MFKIQLNIPVKADNDKLFDSIESLLIQNRFLINRKGQSLTFERKVLKAVNNRNRNWQVIIELFQSLTVGEIYIEPMSTQQLICKISYFKHLVISMLVGFVISFIFSVILGQLVALLFKIGLPVTLLLLVIWILSGNAQMEIYLKKH